MQIAWLITSFLVSFIVHVLDALPSGPPQSACDNMRPFHGVSPPSNLGYALTANTNSFTPGGPAIEVTLSGEDYRGIFLQVRDGNDLASTQRVGAWNIPSSFYQHVACDNPSSSALGHNSRDIKSTSQVFTWTPPDTCDSSTTYQIRASVVRDFSAFETGLAFPIQCVNQAPETTTNPPATQSPEFTPPPEIEGCSFSSFNSIPADYQMGFENGNNLQGWQSSSSPSNSSYRWTVSTGPTLSLATGPNQAFQGTGFVYTEASSPAQPGDQAILSTRTDLRGCFCFRFALSYDTFENSHIFAIEIGGEIIGSASNGTAAWVSSNVNVDTPNFVGIRIIATRGTNWLGDIGLDDLRFEPGTC